ncbi:MAG: PKD domain-containing protein [Gemmatimonadaceae bacterium]
MSRNALSCLAIVIGLAGCTPSTLEPKPLDIGLEANRTTTVPGDTLTFVVSAQGGTLVGIEIDYGDNVLDQFATAGAHTARVTFRHAYLQPGSYTVKAVVTDAAAGQKQATIEIRVN